MKAGKLSHSQFYNQVAGALRSARAELKAAQEEGDDVGVVLAKAAIAAAEPLTRLTNKQYARLLEQDTEALRKTIAAAISPWTSVTPAKADPKPDSEK